MWARCPRSRCPNRAPGGGRTHTEAFLRGSPLPIGIRGPTLLPMLRPLRGRLRVAVRTEDTQVLDSVVAAPPIDVIELERHRESVPGRAFAHLTRRFLQASHRQTPL